MELERIVQALPDVRVERGGGAEIADLAFDARAVGPGALYFCVRGTRADGHDFAADAVARGAVALVVERAVDAAVPQLVVPDARAAMAPAAAAFFGDPSHRLTVAGVTGTNGKTTTAYLAWSVLASAGLRPGLLGNIERRVGTGVEPASLNTPEAIDLQRALRAMVDGGNLACVLEASSHASAQHRLDHTRFAALAFTNLTQDHLDFHGTMEAYFEAKRALFTGPEPPPAAVNVGDPWGRRLADELRERGQAPVLTFSASGPADVTVAEAEPTPGGARVVLADGLRLRTRLPGRFNVENVLAAVALCRLLELDEAAIQGGIASVTGVPGRFERIDEGQGFDVFVDYAHTPEGLALALGAARAIARGRVLCVFGAGGDRDRGKRPLMGRAAAEGADVVVVTSDNPRSEDPAAIAAEVVAGAGEGAVVELDRRRAIELAIGEARPGDVVVVAGKGHEQGQEQAGVVAPFDDREVARAALRAREAAA